MFLARRQDEVEVEGQCARPTEGAERRPRRDVALNGADGLKDVHTPGGVLLAEVSEEVPGCYEVASGGEEVGKGEQRDDLLRSVSYPLEEEVGEEDEERAENGERTGHDGAVGRDGTHVKTDLAGNGAVVDSWTTRRRGMDRAHWNGAGHDSCSAELE